MVHLYWSFAPAGNALPSALVMPPCWPGPPRCRAPASGACFPHPPLPSGRSPGPGGRAIRGSVEGVEESFLILVATHPGERHRERHGGRRNTSDPARPLPGTPGTTSPPGESCRP